VSATATGVDSGRRSSALEAAWRSRAFGLDLEGEFPVSGLPPGYETPDAPPTRIELSSTAALDGAWGAVHATTLEDARGSDGRRVLAVDRDDRLRYRLATADWGNYLVSADGRRVQCAPPSLAGWRRERFLTSRVLPLAATLRGLEVFHSSAVSFGDAVVAIVGPRQIGKTSLAVHLILRGSSFVTDDLLALEVQRNEVVAHPGAAMVGVRESEYRLLQPEQRRRLGPFVKRLDKFFADVQREDRALPLRIVYFLDRRPTNGALAIDELDQHDPRLLLASSFFNGIVKTPERLHRQLDLCAQLSQTAVICRASVPPTVDAAALAASLADHAKARLGVQLDASV
jgi:hypothetical protein